MITILLCLSGLLSLFTALMLQAMKELLRGEIAQQAKEVKGYAPDRKSGAEDHQPPMEPA
jgi:hypothetical protein